MAEAEFPNNVCRRCGLPIDDHNGLKDAPAGAVPKNLVCPTKRKVSA